MKNWTKIIKPKKPKIWTFFKPKNLGLFRSHFPALLLSRYATNLHAFRIVKGGCKMRTADLAKAGTKG